MSKKHNALSCSEGEPQAMSTGVQSLLDDVTVEGNPESSDDFAINNARHITYRGDDIADSFLNQFKIHSEFDRDNIKHAVITSTKGGREFFIVTESNDLEMIWVTHRLRLPYEGPFTCIRSTCIVNTKQKCRGATIVFKLTSSNMWNFGIVSGIHYLNIHCVDEQSQRGLNSGALVGALMTPAKNKKVRQRSNSPKCVSWVYQYFPWSCTDLLVTS